MISLNVEDVKDFMHQLFIDNTFDNFLLCEASIITGCTYNINGKINKDFFDSEELENIKEQSYSFWHQQKHFAFELIKGNKTPSYMKLVLMLNEENLSRIIMQNNLPLSPSDIAGLYANVIYSDKKVTINTGTSLKIFTMDKSIDSIWDLNMTKFLKGHKIAIEERN